MRRVYIVSLVVAMVLSWSATAGAWFIKLEEFHQGCQVGQDVDGLTKVFMGHYLVDGARSNCFPNYTVRTWRYMTMIHFDGATVPYSSQCEFRVAVALRPNNPGPYRATAAYWTNNGVFQCMAGVTFNQEPRFRSTLKVRTSHASASWTGGWPPVAGDLPAYPVVGNTTATNIQYSVTDQFYDPNQLTLDLLSDPNLTWISLGNDPNIGYLDQREYTLAGADPNDVVLFSMNLTPQGADPNDTVTELFEFTVADAAKVPALTLWGQITLGSILMAAAAVSLALRRRRSNLAA